MGKDYLLLDGACFEHLPSLLMQLDSSAAPYPLYAGTRYAELKGLGPWLVAVAPDGPIARTFQREWSVDYGLWLHSSAPQPELLGHLRSMVHVQLEGAGTVLFRFHDPKIAKLWFAALGPLELVQAMGPVQSICWSKHSGGGADGVRGDFPFVSRVYSDTPWLTFTIEQMEQLSAPKRDQFDRQVLAHVQRFFPDALQALDALGRKAWAVACRASAARYNLTSEAQVFAWASLYAAFGEHFPEAPEHCSYRDLLRERGVLPAHRLDNALRKQIRQVYATQALVS
ncbi:DUF4123 domain-containing protein [Pseudomonas sp. SDI]|uniref:DUF4123 domain-containing protein n=1 Tax=Pseudomonas sp. SDI TaxID=2170734 RepID=UPI000DE7894F|nr:DUF4123 domain-containing protein [Pseudomonas sp. SDI]PWB29422.1 DUF4123 domain-containing protein [Pseudomonas sp. SDI]